MDRDQKTTTTQADHGSCKWCAGRGFITLRGSAQVKCPKCQGTGQAPKVTTK